MGHLILASPELNGYLTQFLQPGLRLAVTTPAGRQLAHADALGKSTALGPGPSLLARLYRRFVDRPGERQVTQARAAIYDRDHQVVIGELAVTQTADRWIRLRDQAHAHAQPHLDHKPRGGVGDVRLRRLARRAPFAVAARE
jgi:hypothetical protein